MYGKRRLKKTFSSAIERLNAILNNDDEQQQKREREYNKHPKQPK